MAQKSFLLYNENKEVFDKLTDVEAGQLIKAVFQYEEDKTYTLSNILEIIFTPIRQNLDKNTTRYNNICERNKNNIEKRYSTKSTSGNSGTIQSTKSTNTNINNNINNNKPKKKEIKKNKYLDYVLFAEEEYEKLLERFGKEDLDDRIEKLNHYIGSKGVRYKSHYHTILSWSKKDIKVQPKKVVKRRVLE